METKAHIFFQSIWYSKLLDNKICTIMFQIGKYDRSFVLINISFNLQN